MGSRIFRWAALSCLAIWAMGTLVAGTAGARPRDSCDQHAPYRQDKLVVVFRDPADFSTNALNGQREVRLDACARPDGKPIQVAAGTAPLGSPDDADLQQLALSTLSWMNDGVARSATI